jgi:uncharacterized phage protein gp47/JayE
MAISDNLEQYTYPFLLKDALERAPLSVDRRQGSIIFDTLGASMYELARAFLEMHNISLNSFLETATGEWLDSRAVEYGVERSPATAAQRVIEVQLSNGPGRVQLGSKFSTIDTNNPLYYTITEDLKDDLGTIIVGSYIATCDTPGEIGNTYFGPVLPLDFIQNFESATLGEVYTLGEDEETDDSLRKKIQSRLIQQPFGGNVAQYIELANGLPGIGGVQVYPVWDGGGTVKLSLVGSDFMPLSDARLIELAELIDPPNSAGITGTGIGLAPIDHKVTVVTPTLFELDFDLSVIAEGDTEEDQLLPGIISAINDYLAELRSLWSNPSNLYTYALRVFPSNVSTIAGTAPGVLGVSQVLINQSPDIFSLLENAQTQQLPILRNVSINIGFLERILYKLQNIEPSYPVYDLHEHFVSWSPSRSYLIILGGPHIENRAGIITSKSSDISGPTLVIDIFWLYSFDGQKLTQITSVSGNYTGYNISSGGVTWLSDTEFILGSGSWYSLVNGLWTLDDTKSSSLNSLIPMGSYGISSYPVDTVYSGVSAVSGDARSLDFFTLGFYFETSITNVYDRRFYFNWCYSAVRINLDTLTVQRATVSKLGRARNTIYEGGSEPEFPNYAWVFGNIQIDSRRISIQCYSGPTVVPIPVDPGASSMWGETQELTPQTYEPKIFRYSPQLTWTSTSGTNDALIYFNGDTSYPEARYHQIAFYGDGWAVRTNKNGIRIWGPDSSRDETFIGSYFVSKYAFDLGSYIPAGIGVSDDGQFMAVLGWIEDSNPWVCDWFIYRMDSTSQTWVRIPNVTVASITPHGESSLWAQQTPFGRLVFAPGSYIFSHGDFGLYEIDVTGG